jgi:hypothetical protein
LAADRVDTAVRRIVERINRQANAICCLAIIPILVPIIALGRTTDWRLALALSAAWLAVVGFTLRQLGTRTARRAARRFNRAFPEGSAERPLALGILAGLTSQFSVLRKMKVALGVPPDPQPFAAAPDTGPGAQDRPSLPRAPNPVSIGPGDFLPLDILNRPGPPGPAPPASGKFPYVPLDPLEKPAGTEDPTADPAGG